MSKQKTKDVLVALLKYKKDAQYAGIEHWYRIPTTSKNIPLNVKENYLKIIAFYLPKIFGDYAHTVRWFGEVNDISIQKRKDIIKDEEINAKSENLYYKISFEKLHELPNPIESLGRRRILFITTTQDHLKYAKEINDIFYESPLEEKVWKEFKKIKIYSERQFDIFLSKKPRKRFIVDFALFCKSRKIAIEIDGDTYHMSNEAVRKDKKRDNLLFVNGWDVMRYTSKDINYNIDKTILQVKEAINKYGGINEMSKPRTYKYIRTKDDSQGTLF